MKTAYIRSTQPAKSWTGDRRYVVTLHARKHKRINLGTFHSPLAAALVAARAESQQ